MSSFILNENKRYKDFDDCCIKDDPYEPDTNTKNKSLAQKAIDLIKIVSDSRKY